MPRDDHNVPERYVKVTYRTYFFVPSCVLLGRKGSLPQIHHQPPSVAARTALPSGLTHNIIRHQSPSSPAPPRTAVRRRPSIPAPLPPPACALFTHWVAPSQTQSHASFPPADLNSSSSPASPSNPSRSRFWSAAPASVIRPPCDPTPMRSQYVPACSPLHCAFSVGAEASARASPPHPRARFLPVRRSGRPQQGPRAALQRRQLRSKISIKVHSHQPLDGAPAQQTQGGRFEPGGTTPSPLLRVRAALPLTPHFPPPSGARGGRSFRPTPTQRGPKGPSPFGGIRPQGRRVGRGPFRGSCGPPWLPLAPRRPSTRSTPKNLDSTLEAEVRARSR